MLRTSKVLAGMLVAVFAIAMLPIAGWANSSLHVEQAAGCHSHLPATPAPAQPSHQCCAAGHQWAIPGSPVILHPVIAQAGVHQDAHDLQPHLFSRPTPALISDSPPVTASLRI
ncbi:MAG: hypothetical protein DMG78_08095 [Acidobacteria bacterium]|nr:MAG: hypothetical protein DMG78_08095 [Acidobacteriota bacterium]